LIAVSEPAAELTTLDRPLAEFWGSFHSEEKGGKEKGR